MTRFVFGRGIALINHWKYIKKYFNPEFVVDNDSGKWGKTDVYTGLLCISPDQMGKYDNPQVLISIGDPYAVEQVRKQLQDVNADVTILTEELEKWTGDEPLPEKFESIKKEQKKIFLFNTPEHDNIGDHLISLSEIEFLKQRFRDYRIFEITDIEYVWYHSQIKKYVAPEDVILITGGGFLGSLWLYNGEINVRNILCEYPNNRVIILPQTIYFEQNERGNAELKKTQESYNRHKNLTICAREQASYQLLRSIVKPHVKLVCLPDMALYYRRLSSIKREKTALLCLRTDKESVIPEKTKEFICHILEENGWKIRETSMHSGQAVGIAGREEQIENKLDEISEAGIVITDTLHCMVSAIVTDSPCIAFNNLSGKVKGVYEWVKTQPYVWFCNDLSEFEMIFGEVQTMEPGNNIVNFESYENELEKIIRGRQ